MRKRGAEAVSIGFYIITGSFAVLCLVAIIVYLCVKVEIQLNSGLFAAMIGAAGALIGFHLTIFTLYFSFGMKDDLKSILQEFGFYKQIPKDILRTTIIYGICIVFSILGYFFAERESEGFVKAYDILSIANIAVFLCGLVLTSFITGRFFKIIFANRKQIN